MGLGTLETIFKIGKGPCSSPDKRSLMSSYRSEIEHRLQSTFQVLTLYGGYQYQLSLTYRLIGIGMDQSPRIGRTVQMTYGESNPEPERPGKIPLNQRCSDCGEFLSRHQ